MARRTLYVQEEEVKELLSFSEALSAVEEAFRQKGNGEAIMPPKLIIPLPDGDFRTMPAYLPRLRAAGVKIVNSHPDNRRKGLPTVMAILIMLEPETGFPLAVIEATHLTGLRTGAAGALGIRVLARPTAKVAALIGAGIQGRFQLLGLKEVLPQLERVQVWSRDEELAWRLKGEMEERLKVAIEVFPEAEGAVRGAEVIVTTTPSRTPILRDEWIREGVHITCVGADAPGKQELDPAILRRARVFLDDMAQGIESGEVNVPLKEGQLKREEIVGELSEVLIGKKPGRLSDADITVFSTTGLAIQDVACGALILQKLGLFPSRCEATSS